MKILVTGANGFIGKNLCVFLCENGFNTIIKFGSESPIPDLDKALDNADFVFHIAGVNRPKDLSEFEAGNAGLTEYIVRFLKKRGKSTPLLLTSSVQAELDNPYGKSKASAEQSVFKYGAETGALTYVYRLPNVFGKWSRPNYNSAVATFCYNTLHGMPVKINDSEAKMTLAYIDDVCEAFIQTLKSKSKEDGFKSVDTVYHTTVGEVASIIKSFKQNEGTLNIGEVGTGLKRALYSTYISYFEPAKFAYSIPRHADERGVFVEMLKTDHSGQFSFFTALPGITRGGHYHHTKNEKFIVIKGKASFRFRNVMTNDFYEIIVDGTDSKVVETVPGWSHDVTNIGDDELIVMLWANEIFNPQKPDTISHKV